MQQNELYTGKVIGFLTLRMKLAYNKNAPAYKRQKWRVECVCGKRMTLPEYYLTRPTPKTHCGCQLKTAKTTHNQEYRIWCMMHQRCLFESHVAYKHYGGRGIKICYDWLSKDYGGNPDGKGFDRFLAFIGPRPSKEYSVDRVDNDLGYQPFQADGKTRQVRWATAKEQRANQRS